MIKQRILDIYSQTWYASINNSNHLQTYSLFKHDLRFEAYLDFIGNSKFRNTLIKFRASSHNLSIEKGRHLNLPVIQRTCQNCNSGMVESEYHFLRICPKFSEREKTT